MSDVERDKEILDVITREHSFQWEYFERLEGKLSNCIFMAATVGALYLGLVSFSLERISLENRYYWPVVVALVFGVGLFVLTIAFSLWGFRPMKYKHFPADVKRFINKHKLSKLISIIQEEGATIAEIVDSNRENNNKKAKTLQRAFWTLGLGAFMIIVSTMLLVLALGVP